MPSKPGAFRAFSARSTSEREIVKDTSSWLSSVIGAASIGGHGGSPSSADWEACLTKKALRISAFSLSLSLSLSRSQIPGIRMSVLWPLSDRYLRSIVFGPVPNFAQRVSNYRKLQVTQALLLTCLTPHLPTDLISFGPSRPFHSSVSSSLFQDAYSLAGTSSLPLLLHVCKI